ncbi:MAG: bifunctional metallophosphatase/5'-nucleotidase [Muribaculaceae bacterium]|nr:bifunctional metallophosphatase/5'-nucleotidase [Muribaculaceae bacterium]
MKKIFLSILSFVMLSLMSVSHGETVRILSANDMHAAIEKMPKLSAIVDSLRAIDPGLLILSGGDNRTGNPYNDLYVPVSYPMTSFMNFIGFDASALGNHEYDSKVEGLAQTTALSNFRYLAANITCPEETGIKVVPYQVFDVNGVKVGVLGITQVGTLGIPDTHPDNVKGLSFQQPDEVIPQYKWLTEQCDVNVLLTHVGFENDVELANRYPYYDLIVSSHTHTQLEGGELHNGVLISQNGYQLPRVTLTTLEVENGKVVDKRAENIFLDKFSRRNDVADALLKYFKSSPEMERVIGESKSNITTYDALGVMMCDAWKSELDCDITFENYGGVRYDNFPAGPITVKDILNLDPFMNTAVVMNLTGKELSDMLIACFKADRNRFPVTSGCTAVVTYNDQSKSEIKKLELFGPDGKKLDMKKKYRVMTNNYVASIADSPRQDQGERGVITTSDLIIRWLEKVKTVDYQGCSSFTEKW